MTTIPRPPTFLLDASLTRFSVPRYLRMVREGIFDDDDRVELLEGFVVNKMSRNPPHDNTLERLMEAILTIRPAGWRLRIQSALQLTDSVPEPDFALVRRPSDPNDDRHPTAAEVGLLIEVAEPSLGRDIEDKARIYARAGVPAYWVVDLVNRRVVVFAEPSGPGDAPAFGRSRDYRSGEAVPLVLDGTTVGELAVDDLLPRA